MPAQITLNPFVTTNAYGSFNVESNGFVQGTLVQNPVEMFKIAGGIVSQVETIPMWGGVLIKENMPGVFGPTVPNYALGGTIQRATSISDWTGFTVFDMAQAGLTTPQSPVPLFASGNSINHVRKGSNVRLAVACDPVLVSLEGSTVFPQVSWDFNNQCLQPYDAATSTYALSTMVWAATNGGQIAVVAAVPTLVGAVGDTVNISGATANGTGGNAAVNGNFTVNTFTDNEHFTVSAPNIAAYYGTIVASSAVINAGTGAFPIEVIQITAGNSMVVQYNSATGFAQWNRSGCCAVVIV